MKIAIGCDNLAINLKQAVIAFIEEQDRVKVEIKDFGVYTSDPVDYLANYCYSVYND